MCAAACFFKFESQGPYSGTSPYGHLCTMNRSFLPPILWADYLVSEAWWPSGYGVMEGSGLSLGQGHCVVFLGKTLHSYSAFLPPGV